MYIKNIRILVLIDNLVRLNYRLKEIQSCPTENNLQLNNSIVLTLYQMDQCIYYNLVVPGLLNPVKCYTYSTQQRELIVLFRFKT